MKLGLSIYSLSKAISSGEMTVIEAIEWIKDNGGQHVEIVPYRFDLDDQLIDDIRQKTDELGLEVSNYAIPANFVDLDEVEFSKELNRVKEHVDIAHRLGAKRMRHDVASRPLDKIYIHQFETDLPVIVKACQEIADYAKQYGVVTSIENHGYYVQASDRVQRVLHLVNRSNFKTTLDIGNFLCADENPLPAVTKNLPYASIIHFKDFYVRPQHKNPGEGWFQSASGNFLKGAIFGNGDIDVRSILKVIKESGYNGHISLEFEGLEDCRLGARIGFDNVRRIWDEL
jgi:sugar phosphate isomerase/epimerase